VLTVGVDVGGSFVRAGVVDADGQVVETVRAATPQANGALDDAIVLAVRSLVDRYQPGAAGLAVAGFVTADRQRVMFAPHLPWRQVPVVARIGQRLAIPVILEHDANAAAVAEYRFGAAAGSRHAVLITIGTGIGSALLVHGQVYRGAHGVAPELGHLRVVPDGRSCPCGKRGCWERYCSGTALVEAAVALHGAAADPSQFTGRSVAEAARAGDPLARQAMAELAYWLGAGLALVSDVYDPDLVVIGGGVAESAPLFLDRAVEHYANMITGAGFRPVAQVRTARLGDEAGIVGAAMLAHDLVFG
jgi:glucokinase